MHKKRRLLALLCFLALMAIPQVANAATMSSCTLDKDTYLQGETCVISATVYNDENDKIRVTQVSATIDYYTEDGVRYVLKSFTATKLPDEIPVGQSATYQVSITLPSNIASGYTNPTVEVSTQLWHHEEWTNSDYLNSNYLSTKPKIYIESPYKQLHENSQQQYETSQQQYQEQLSVSGYLTNMMNIFIVTTIVFASVAGFLFVFLMRKARPTAQP